MFPTISAVSAGYEVQAVMDASGTDTAIRGDMERRRMEHAARHAARQVDDVGIAAASNRLDKGMTGGRPFATPCSETVIIDGFHLHH
ncbi:hypothetical protein [Sphingomonas xinjiangensis]|uniref:Uncharacterized protein n=1 Tax=Sphingomonas xinjiangensis TaxID=643568 RepID=A0A840YTS0_9SPHN|nr:hypothetical protein [Sphingomonas xinjiangensis]MBB5713013.1 hypothetical protein [Sphingomonas xinjiangensis]